MAVKSTSSTRCAAGPTPCPTSGLPARPSRRWPRATATIRAEVHLSQGGQDYCVMGWTRDQITHDVLNHYENHLQFLHSMR
jgi:choline/glycine/proline betaine transport protein